MKKLKYRNITVSGLPGAGSSTLAKKLAKTLKWEYFSGGDFMRQYAIEKGLFDKENAMHHDATIYGDEFDREVDLGMRRSLKREQRKVLDAWLSGFMAQGVEGVLKILLYCGKDDIRVDRVVNRDRVSVEEAKKHIFERERKNTLKWRRMYAGEWQEWVVGRGVVSRDEKIDFWDKRLYDLVIDTYSNSREDTLKLALEALGYAKAFA